MKKAKATTAKVPITARALIQRINRKLSGQNEQLKAIRGDRWRNELGDYYIIDLDHNAVIEKPVDLEKLGTQKDCLAAWEELGE